MPSTSGHGSDAAGSSNAASSAPSRCAPGGRYSATPNYFATSAVVNGYLHAPADGANGGNGVYGYFGGGGFPAGSYQSTNYWVDVLFSQTTTDATPTSSTTARGTTGAARVSTCPRVIALTLEPPGAARPHPAGATAGNMSAAVPSFPTGRWYV